MKSWDVYRAVKRNGRVVDDFLGNVDAPDQDQALDEAARVFGAGTEVDEVGDYDAGDFDPRPCLPTRGD